MWFRSSQISGWFCPEYRFWIPLIKLRRSYLNEFRIRIRQAYKLSSAKWHFRMLPLKTIFKNFIAALPNIVSALPSFVKEVLIHMYIVRYTQKRIYGGGIGQHRSLATPVFSLDHFFSPPPLKKRGNSVRQSVLRKAYHIISDLHFLYATFLGYNADAP